MSANFYNFSDFYVTNTQSNIQRELEMGKVARDAILENKLFTAISSLLCKTNTNLHQLQKLFLTHWFKVELITFNIMDHLQ